MEQTSSRTSRLSAPLRTASTTTNNGAIWTIKVRLIGVSYKEPVRQNALPEAVGSFYVVFVLLVSVNTLLRWSCIFRIFFFFFISNSTKIITRSPANAKRTARLLQKYYRETPNIWELPKIWAFPFNIYTMAEASDFKFGTLIGFAKAHHKTTPRGKMGVALG